ncbi:MAG TPA: glycosyltransferase family 4 protein [Candidatus Saccharimonadales bacterium]|nr:glycosyltransferase family 4 protein [Candidatus Saccharimonadales bacterium]
MRVAIIAGPYLPIPPLMYGGTERVIANLVKGLKEAGHEPVLFGPGDSKPGCPVIPIVDKHIFFPRTAAGLPAFQKEIKRIHKYTHKLLKENLNGIDIIHSHDIDLEGFEDFPNLTTIHGPITFKQLEYYTKRTGLYFASISKNQQEAYPALQWVGAVYNGDDPKKFPIITRPENYVCFVSRFDREKNPHLAIELAINYGIKIKLAGKIDFLGDDYFKTEIKPYFKHPLVEYLGEIPQKEKIKLVGRAKLNLHPTGFREPFGLTVLEAAYCGTPTMAITRGSMPELIEEGRTGLLVEDFVEGYHQIEECFAMDREYIAKRARKLFNYQVMTKQYLRAYKKILRIYEIREREERKIERITDKSKRELETIWERDAQDRIIPGKKLVETTKRLTKPVKFRGE